MKAVFAIALKAFGLSVLYWIVLLVLLSTVGDFKAFRYMGF
jgi:uncharacterized protein Smg (DUF494 family)